LALQGRVATDAADAGFAAVDIATACAALALEPGIVAATAAASAAAKDKVFLNAFSRGRTTPVLCSKRTGL
jgi:hypothetical protein